MWMKGVVIVIKQINRLCWTKNAAINLKVNSVIAVKIAEARKQLIDIIQQSNV